MIRSLSNKHDKENSEDYHIAYVMLYSRVEAFVDEDDLSKIEFFFAVEDGDLEKVKQMMEKHSFHLLDLLDHLKL